MVGFYEHEIQAFRSVMLDMEADMVKVTHKTQSVDTSALQHCHHGLNLLQIIICDRRMFQQTLRQALEAPGHMHSQVCT